VALSDRPSLAPRRSFSFAGVIDAAGEGIVTIVAGDQDVSTLREGDDVVVTNIPRAKSHTHRWSVFYARSGPESLCLLCEIPDCDAQRFVDNRNLFPEVN
jgi:hypothetical protein